MHRRQFIASAGAALAGTLFPTCGCAARTTKGCGLALAVSGDDDELPQRLPTSGVADIDAYCAREAADLNRRFGIAPEFGFYDDSAGANAFAVAPGGYGAGSPTCIVLGIGLAKLIHRSTSDRGLLPITAILAHEWGHALQYQRRLDANWGATVELHADFLAGWYLAITRSSDRDLMLKISQVFGELGDTHFLNPGHHGTPKQRANVMRAGANSYAFPDGKVPDGSSAQKLPETAEAAYELGLWTVRH